MWARGWENRRTGQQHKPPSTFPVRGPPRGVSPQPTDAARGADADDGDVGAAGVVQQFDELVQHDGDGRDPHAMLEAERRWAEAGVHLGQHSASLLKGPRVRKTSVRGTVVTVLRYY